MYIITEPGPVSEPEFESESELESEPESELDSELWNRFADPQSLNQILN